MKELGVKTELNNAVNIPIIIISSIIALHVFILSTDLGLVYFYSFNLLLTLRILSLLNFLLIIISLIYLSKSYMNWGLAHTYKEIGSMNSFHKYFSDLEKEGQIEEFEPSLERELADSATNYFEVNNDRTQALATAKKWLFGSIAFTLLNSFIFILLIATKNQI